MRLYFGFKLLVIYLIFLFFRKDFVQKVLLFFPGRNYILPILPNSYSLVPCRIRTHLFLAEFVLTCSLPNSYHCSLRSCTHLFRIAEFMAISAILEPRSPILKRLSTTVPREIITSWDSSLRIDACNSSTLACILSILSIT